MDSPNKCKFAFHIKYEKGARSEFYRTRAKKVRNVFHFETQNSIEINALLYCLKKKLLLNKRFYFRTRKKHQKALDLTKNNRSKRYFN